MPRLRTSRWNAARTRSIVSKMRPHSLDAPKVIGKLITGDVVLAILDRLDVDFIATEKEAVTYCPFHEQEEGSRPHMYINVQHKPGVYHCFRCEARGDFENFLMRYTGWNVYKCLDLCRKISKGVERGEIEPPARRESGPGEFAEADPLSKYAFRHEYLYERGLTEETLQRFDIGYDRAENEITFPWFSRTGELVAIKRRNCVSKAFRYSLGGDRLSTLFGLNHVKLKGVTWIVESEIDAMTLDQVFRIAHYEDFFALGLGGSTLAPTQIEALKPKQPRAIVLMLDNDDPGREAQRQIRAKLVEHVTVPIIEVAYPGPEKDANAMTFEQIAQIAQTVSNHVAAKAA